MKKAISALRVANERWEINFRLLDPCIHPEDAMKAIHTRLQSRTERRKRISESVWSVELGRYYTKAEIIAKFGPSTKISPIDEILAEAAEMDGETALS